MISDSEDLNIPQAFYFDTNVVLQLPCWDSNVPFIELRNSARLFKSGLFVPEVVKRELAQRRIIEARQLLTQMSEASQKIGDLLVMDPLKYEGIDNVHSRVTDVTAVYLDTIGVEVVPTPENISLELLIDMAICKEAPFQWIGEKGEKGEKGFKDTIILFTIMDHMKRSSFKNAIFLTADEIFTDRAVSNRLKAEGLEIVIRKDFKDANEYMKPMVESTIKERIEQQNEKIKAFLTDRFEDISRYLMNTARISREFLKPTGLRRAFAERTGKYEDLEGYTIKRILSVQPKEISKVFVGHLSEDEPKKEGVIPVIFSVSLQFDLVIEGIGPYGPQSLGTSMKFPLSAPEEFEKTGQSFLLPTSEVHERTVFRAVAVEASISLENDNYKNLEISKIYDF